MLTVENAALCLLAIALTLNWWLARRVARLSKLVSRAMQRAKAPERWESRLAEMAAEVASLSSSFEKVATAVTRQNSRIGMRAHRSNQGANEAPPVGTSKAELRKFYFPGKAGPEFARAQMSLVPPPKE